MTVSLSRISSGLLVMLALSGCKKEEAALAAQPTPQAAASSANSPVQTVIVGRPFDDQLSGTAGADRIDALAGDDIAIGGPGDDIIDGGAGNDLLIGDGDLPSTDDPAAPPLPNPAPAGPDHHPTNMGWTLVWSDEFDANALDATKWAPEVSCWGGGNSEKQCYTDRSDNVQVVNGLLRLIARKEEFTGPTNPPEWNDPDPQNTQAYTSGKVRTRGLADWRYGRIAVRAKIPAGQGMWPAIWMMPIEDHYGTWPLSGEIDIMEAVNVGALCTDCGGSGENRTSSAIHYGNAWPANQFRDHRTTLADGTLPSNDYHVYAVEWGEGLMHFFVDDQLHFTLRNHEWFTSAANAAGNDNAPFDRPFYLMANLAVGGTWPESANALGIDPNALPNEFLIDWVRVYQCAEDLETGRACMQ